MGQRLNLEIIDGEKCLANAYYHWSGYSTSSLRIAKQACAVLLRKDLEPTVQNAIKCLEATGATFNKECWDASKKQGDVVGEWPGCDGRNDGLIGTTEESIKETRSWEEGRIEIDIVKKIFNFKCCWGPNSEEYVEDNEITEDEIKAATKLKFDSLLNIPISEIDFLLAEIEECEKNRGLFYVGKDLYGSIY